MLAHHMRLYPPYSSHISGTRPVTTGIIPLSYRFVLAMLVLYVGSKVPKRDQITVLQGYFIEYRARLRSQDWYTLIYIFLD